MKFQFSNVGVVNEDQIGVIVKSWQDKTYDVYVRSYNGVTEFKEEDIKHYVFSKELTEEEIEFYE
jgi:hypothetical protein